MNDPTMKEDAEGLLVKAAKTIGAAIAKVAPRKAAAEGGAGKAGPSKENNRKAKQKSRPAAAKRTGGTRKNVKTRHAGNKSGAKRK